MDDRLLTVEQAAAFLAVSRCTVYRLVRRSAIPAIGLPGPGIRFRKADLDLWLDRSALPFHDHRGDPAPSLTPTRRRYRRGPHEIEGGRREMAPSAKSKSRLNFGFGAIYQRKTLGGIPRWYLDYRDAKGKRVQRLSPRAGSPDDAEADLRSTVRQVLLEEANPSHASPKVLFRELSMEYLERHSKVHKRSWKSDVYYLKKLLPPFGDTPIGEIRTLQIEEYIASRLREGKTKSTVNREMACLRKIFNKAIDWEYLDKSPMARIRSFSEKDRVKQRILGFDEEERLLAVCRPGLRPFLLLGIHAGLRRSEILNLQWIHVDMVARQVRITNTKSGRDRYIPMNGTLFHLFSRLYPQKGESALIFPNPRTGLPFRDIKRGFSTACRKAGIVGLRFHDLRHTFASRLVAEGVDLITVKELLGHSTVRMTERYTHSRQDLKRSAVERLDLLRPCDMGRAVPVN